MQKKAKNMRVNVDGQLPAEVTAKDIILAVIAKIGTGGGQGHVIEYRGSVRKANRVLLSRTTRIVRLLAYLRHQAGRLPADTASSTHSIQCRTGVAVPLRRCAIHPILAESTTSGRLSRRLSSFCARNVRDSSGCNSE